MSLVYTHVNCRVDWSCPGSGGHSGGQVAMSWLAQVALNGLTQPGWLLWLVAGVYHFITPLSIESNRLSPDNFPVTSGKLSHNCSLHCTESL